MGKPLEKVLFNNTKNEEIEVPCQECHRKTFHKVIESVDIVGKENIESFGLFEWEKHYQIIQCQGCKSYSFRQIHSNSEDWNQIGPEEFEPRIYENLYPNRLAGRKKLEDSHFLPSKVRKIYNETINNLISGQEILTGIGIRAIIETVCKDKSAEGKDLYNKINFLVERGMITQDGAEILHKLRILGNRAAHEVEPHTEEQLALAMDAVEHLLEGAYIFPKKIKRAFSEEE
jgi:hypothetical protein